MSFPSFNTIYRVALPEDDCKNTFKCTASDTLTNTTWKQEHCVPKSTRENKVPFTFNLAVIFTVGFLGNVLTLLAFPYAWIYYKRSFPGVLYQTFSFFVANANIAIIIITIIIMTIWF